MFLVALVVFGCYWHAIVQRMMVGDYIIFPSTQTYKNILLYFFIITIEAILPQKCRSYPEAVLKIVNEKPLKHVFREV